MTWFGKLFSTRPKVECPRCLGKGEVDQDDIKRLHKELRWITGPCAYCNGIGKVDPEMPSRISVDNPYLTTDLSKDERKRIIKGDKGALERASYQEIQIENTIKQIEYLYNTGNMESKQILEFYLITETEWRNTVAEKELLDFIEKVIEHQNRR